MEKKEFLTPEQRKGLMYGSLISAIISGGAAMRTGGNAADAIGRGVLGAAQGYGGGVERLAKIQHDEIENAKTEETMNLAREAQAISRQSHLTSEELARSKEKRDITHSQQQQEIGAESLKESRRKAAIRAGDLERYNKLFANEDIAAAAAESGETPGQGPIFSPKRRAILEAIGPGENFNSVLQEIVKDKATPYVNIHTGTAVGVERGDAVPAGVTTPAMAVGIKKVEAAEKNTDKKIASAEKIAEKGVASKEKVSAAGNVSKEKIGKGHDDTKEKIAVDKIKTKVYWDATAQQPVQLKEGTNTASQWDPDKNAVAKKRIATYSKKASPVSPATPKPLPKF